MKSRSLAIILLSLVGSLFITAGGLALQNVNLGIDGPTILSDTHGYDFTNYLKLLTNRVRVKWYAAIPDAAKQGQKGRVVLTFTVLRDGAIWNLRSVSGSGTESLDEAASSAIQSASPFSPLPSDFSDSQIVVQFTFLYNQR